MNVCLATRNFCCLQHDNIPAHIYVQTYTIITGKKHINAIIVGRHWNNCNEWFDYYKWTVRIHNSTNSLDIICGMWGAKRHTILSNHSWIHSTCILHWWKVKMSSFQRVIILRNRLNFRILIVDEILNFTVANFMKLWRILWYVMLWNRKKMWIGIFMALFVNRKILQ